MLNDRAERVVMISAELSGIRAWEPTERGRKQGSLISSWLTLEAIISANFRRRLIWMVNLDSACSNLADEMCHKGRFGSRDFCPKWPAGPRLSKSLEK